MRDASYMGLIILRVILGCTLAYVVVMYAFDLWFYWRNGWNFDEDHPGFVLLQGDDDHGQEPMDPPQRLFFGWPMAVLVSGSITIGFFCIERLN